MDKISEEESWQAILEKLDAIGESTHAAAPNASADAIPTNLDQDAILATLVTETTATTAPVTLEIAPKQDTVVKGQPLEQADVPPPYDAKLYALKSNQKIDTFKTFFLRPQVDFCLQSRSRASRQVLRFDLLAINRLFRTEEMMLFKYRRAKYLNTTVSQADIQNYNIEIKDALTQFHQRVNEATTLGIQNAQPWIASVVDYLRRKLPADTRVNKEYYLDNKLYIVCLPEFGFNKYWVPNPNNSGQNVDRVNAAHPIPSGVETYITMELHKALKEHFRHLQVLFVFSCCTYSKEYLFLNKLNEKPDMNLSITHEEDKKRVADWVTRRVAAFNKTTVISSTDALPKTITKFDVSTVDGWPSKIRISKDTDDHLKIEQVDSKIIDTFGREAVLKLLEVEKATRTRKPVHILLEPNATLHDGKKILPGNKLYAGRYDEIMIDLEQIFNSEGKIMLSCCIDLAKESVAARSQVDKMKQQCNLLLLLGGGAPLDKLSGWNRSFLMNDALCSEQDNNPWQPGYYEYQIAKPSDAESGAKRWVWALSRRQPPETLSPASPLFSMKLHKALNTDSSRRDDDIIWELDEQKFPWM